MGGGEADCGGEAECGGEVEGAGSPMTTFALAAPVLLTFSVRTAYPAQTHFTSTAQRLSLTAASSTDSPSALISARLPDETVTVQGGTDRAAIAALCACGRGSTDRAHRPAAHSAQSSALIEDPNSRQEITGKPA